MMMSLNVHVFILCCTDEKLEEKIFYFDRDFIWLLQIDRGVCVCAHTSIRMHVSVLCVCVCVLFTSITIIITTNY